MDENDFRVLKTQYPEMVVVCQYEDLAGWTRQQHRQACSKRPLIVPLIIDGLRSLLH